MLVETRERDSVVVITSFNGHQANGTSNACRYRHIGHCAVLRDGGVWIHLSNGLNCIQTANKISILNRIRIHCNLSVRARGQNIKV